MQGERRLFFALVKIIVNIIKFNVTIVIKIGMSQRL